MTADDRQGTLEQHLAKAEELGQAHQVLREQRAELGDYSARVHDEAARVHEELGERSQLDPQSLREHAERDREMARKERAALAEDQAED